MAMSDLTAHSFLKMFGGAKEPAGLGSLESLRSVNPTQQITERYNPRPHNMGGMVRSDGFLFEPTEIEFGWMKQFQEGILAGATVPVKELSPEEARKKVEEIHQSFDAAADTAVAELVASLEGISSQRIDRAARLSMLGFSQAKDVTSGMQEKAKQDKATAQLELIRYYQHTYPTRKIIPESVAKAICKKYNLICGEVMYYKGDIPEKNIAEMEAYTPVHESDRMYAELVSERGVHMDRYQYTQNPTDSFGRPLMSTCFLICAPKDDMHHRLVQGEGLIAEVRIPDPVVLQPVRGIAGVMMVEVVTKWGLEANDPELANERMN